MRDRLFAGRFASVVSCVAEVNAAPAGTMRHLSAGMLVKRHAEVSATVAGTVDTLRCQTLKFPFINRFLLAVTPEPAEITTVVFGILSP
jgi:hypothetical protein